MQSCKSQIWIESLPFKALTLHCRILDQHYLLNLIQYNISIWCHSHGTTALKIQVLPSFSIPSTKYMQDDTLIPTIQVWEARPNFKHVQIQARPNSNSIGPLGSMSKIKPSDLCEACPNFKSIGPLGNTSKLQTIGPLGSTSKFNFNGPLGSTSKFNFLDL